MRCSCGSYIAFLNVVQFCIVDSLQITTQEAIVTVCPSSGAAGIIGSEGGQGSAGRTGATGGTGPSGPQGTRGDRGSTGSSGEWSTAWSLG